MRSAKARPTTIDQYLDALEDDKRRALALLRRTIKGIIPRGEECISYGLPAFRFEGHLLVWFGAGANHCAFYPGAVVQAFKDDLKKYEISKGTIRFQPDHPLPAALVRKLVKARIAQTARKPEKKSRSR